VKEDDVVALIETDKVSKAFAPRLHMERKFWTFKPHIEEKFSGYCGYQGDKGRCCHEAIRSCVSGLVLFLSLLFMICN
jgi:hypothetical protein